MQAHLQKGHKTDIFPVLQKLTHMYNQIFTHRLDKEAWHVGYDIDKEDCSQHHHKSLGETIVFKS